MRLFQHYNCIISGNNAIIYLYKNQLHLSILTLMKAEFIAGLLYWTEFIVATQVLL